MRTQYGEGSNEFSIIEEDSSNDDYVYYGENKVLDYKLHERFFRMLGHDGNTPESGGSDNKTAVTLKPDTEGLLVPHLYSRPIFTISMRLILIQPTLHVKYWPSWNLYSG